MLCYILGMKYLSSYPDLVKEWHPTKNGDLTSNDFTYGSEKKVWWLCPKGHSYETRVYSRTGEVKNGCPYCSGRRASENNNLNKKFPEIAREWHPTKNKVGGYVLMVIALKQLLQTGLDGERENVHIL
jgi:hypothetical protein